MSDGDGPDLIVPRDLAAEKAVLSGCMWSPSAVTSAAAVLTVEDFFHPHHQTLWAAILVLRERGAPAEPVLLLDYFRSVNVKFDVPFLHDVYQMAPPSGAAEYHAEIVADCATRRRVIQAGRRIQQRGMNAAVDTADLVEWSAEQVREARDARHGVEVLTRSWETFLHETPEDRPMVIPGLLGKGDRLVLTGSGGLGKALAVDTPIPTPKGWTVMGDLTAGDEIFGPDGLPARVIATSDIMVDRPCYRVTFSDGATVTADAEHLWLTDTAGSRRSTFVAQRRGDASIKPRGTDQSAKRVRPAVRTTREIAETLWARPDGTEANHSIDVCAPLRYPEQDLPIPPYVLGCWLGDGTSASAGFTCADSEIIDYIRAEDVPCRKLGAKYRWIFSDGVRRGRYQSPDATIQGRLRTMGVLGDKHIPRMYLEASLTQRLALLQGLMDTDGTVNNQAKGATVCEFSVTNPRLAADTLELILGLGIKAVMRASAAKLNGRTVGVRYRIPFQTSTQVFRLPRKATKIGPLRTPRSQRRHIIACDPVESVPVQCIQVDRPDGLFLVGRECIATHNSTLLHQLAVCAAAGIPPMDWHTADSFTPARVTLMDFENPDHRVRTRLWPLVKEAKDAGCPVEDRLRLGGQGNSFDLLNPQNAMSLLKTMEHDQPDLLYIGPVYKLHNDDPDKEVVVKKITAVLDQIREMGVAIITEAHHTKGAKVGGSLEPSGSNLWTWWPEFGLGLRLDKDSDPNIRRCALERWRIDRDANQWPDFVEAGGKWPWARAKHGFTENYV